MANNRSDTKGIELGDIVKDRISGFKGVVTSITDWLNGCRRMGVQPEEMRDGKPIDTQHFDVEQVDLVEKRSVSAMPHGGDRSAPTRNSDPTR